MNSTTQDPDRNVSQNGYSHADNITKLSMLINKQLFIMVA